MDSRRRASADDQPDELGRAESAKRVSHPAERLSSRAFAASLIVLNLAFLAALITVLALLF
jgi:hypothetical protein